jgi:hypothetical protein
MNISSIVRKVLLEQEVKGVDYKDQYDILEKGRQYCSDFARVIEGRKIKALTGSEVDKFPELKGNSQVAYVTTKPDNDGYAYAFFAIKDPSITDKTSFLTYQISSKAPRKVPEGWGIGCDYFQSRKDVSKDTLSDINRATLQSFLDDNKGTYYEFVDKASQYEFDRVPYAELTYSDGRKVLPDYKGDGFVFVRKRKGNVLQDKVGQLGPALEAQNFTAVEPTDATSPEANAGFLLVDVAKDYPALASLAKDSPNTKIWPKPGTLSVPDKGACRDIIKLLDRCSKQSSVTSECLTNLWKNKVLALQCGDKKYIGGAFGLKDEYEALLSDGGKFGLANLKYARVKGFDRSSETPASSGPDLSIKENVKYIVSKVLNEEYKRRNRL